MKVQRSDEISAFGGINFVFDFLESNNFGTLLNRELPSLKSQSQYNWKDIIYALMSVYFCGGEYIEDLGTHLSPHFKKNPFVKIPVLIPSSGGFNNYQSKASNVKRKEVQLCIHITPIVSLIN